MRLHSTEGKSMFQSGGCAWSSTAQRVVDLGVSASEPGCRTRRDIRHDYSDDE
jgi:hypothetical protein